MTDDKDENLNETTPSATTQTKVYDSAVDWWIWPVILAAPVICLVLAAYMLQRGNTRDAITLLAVGLASLIITGMFTVPCRYTITPDMLNIRAGILFMRVPLEKIKSVEKSSSWISGPSLSLKRIKVSTPSKVYLISPNDRESFIADLNAAIQSQSGKSAV